jgi:hypothetical protein
LNSELNPARVIGATPAPPLDHQMIVDEFGRGLDENPAQKRS